MEAAMHYGTPIVTTSRSGRPGKGADQLQMFEALTAYTTVYCAICDVGKAQELCDMMNCLGRPGLPTRKRLVTLGDIAASYTKMMHEAPLHVLQHMLDVTESVAVS